jgi:hypothetical protein
VAIYDKAKGGGELFEQYKEATAVEDEAIKKAHAFGKAGGAGAELLALMDEMLQAHQRRMDLLAKLEPFRLDN